MQPPSVDTESLQNSRYQGCAAGLLASEESRETISARMQDATHQRRYFGTKMAAKMTRSGSSTWSSFKRGLLDCKLACCALTALIEALFVLVASPS